MNNAERIAELEAGIARLKAEDDIDWTQHIGRMVEVRDSDAEDWLLEILTGYFPDAESKFTTSNTDFYWEQCRLVNCPVRPNWINAPELHPDAKDGDMFICHYINGNYGFLPFSVFSKLLDSGDLTRYAIIRL